MIQSMLVIVMTGMKMKNFTCFLLFPSVKGMGLFFLLLLLLVSVDSSDASESTTTTTKMDKEGQQSYTTKNVSCSVLSYVQTQLFHSRPTATMTQDGEVEGIDFWSDYETILHQAWEEWWSLSQPKQQQEVEQHNQPTSLPLLLEEEMIHPGLYQSIHEMWDNPTKAKEEAFLHYDSTLSTASSSALSSVWYEPIPDVFVYRNFFTTEGIHAIRQHLLAIQTNVSIPTRRPNGMNRNGIVIDEMTPGGVSYEGIISFRNWLIDSYIRPIARSFFPQYSGRKQKDDFETYAFTIHYHHHHHHSDSDDDNDDNESLTNDDDDGSRRGPTMRMKKKTSSTIKPGIMRDKHLPQHTDSSLFTLNVNLNLPDETFEGSELVFAVLDGKKKKKDNDSTSDSSSSSSFVLQMEPGMAVLHRGLHRHETLPIQGGSRHQLVIWLFGEYGYVRSVPYPSQEQRTLKQRWTRSVEEDDEDEGLLLEL